MKNTIFGLLYFLTIPLFAGEQTSVQSDTAYYNGKEVILKGSVLIENSLAKIKAEDAKLLRAEVKSKIDFPKLELAKNVVATLYNGSELHCDLVKLDYDALTGFFYGNRQTQLYLSDSRGEIYADHALVNYGYVEESYKPVKITLTDHVRLIHSSSLQYALADIVEYFPEEGTILLKAGEGKKVLFFDQSKNMHLSALMVKGDYDRKTGSQSFQGVGDVRFIFGRDELEKFKKQFKIE